MSDVKHIVNKILEGKSVKEAIGDSDYERQVDRFLDAVDGLESNFQTIIDLILDMDYIATDGDEDDPTYFEELEKVFNLNNPFKKDLRDFTELYSVVQKWKADLQEFFGR